MQRSNIRQPESPGRDQLRINPSRLVMGAGVKRREDGVLSDGGLPTADEPRVSYNVHAQCIRDDVFARESYRFC